jgi:hypothetical protein
MIILADEPAGPDDTIFEELHGTTIDEAVESQPSILSCKCFKAVFTPLGVLFSSDDRNRKTFRE